MAGKQRLDKVLATMGVGTRSEVKELCRKKLVTVDGVVVRDPSTHIDPLASRVEVSGDLVAYIEYIYLMMNKPDGVVSATDDNRDETVIDLLEAQHRVLSPFPVGRLDKDTVGLLLITNDGALAHDLLHPKKHVSKLYEAVVDGVVDESHVTAVAAGVTLDDGYVTHPAALSLLDVQDGVSKIHLTITEGKFHQVKRMFLAMGMTVLHLKRLTMGPLELDSDLEPGEYRELTEEELSALRGRGY